MNVHVIVIFCCHACTLTYNHVVTDTCTRASQSIATTVPVLQTTLVWIFASQTRFAFCSTFPNHLDRKIPKNNMKSSLPFVDVALPPSMPFSLWSKYVGWSTSFRLHWRIAVARLLLKCRQLTSNWSVFPAWKRPALGSPSGIAPVSPFSPNTCHSTCTSLQPPDLPVVISTRQSPSGEQ